MKAREINDIDKYKQEAIIDYKESWDLQQFQQNHPFLTKMKRCMYCRMYMDMALQQEVAAKDLETQLSTAIDNGRQEKLRNEATMADAEKGRRISGDPFFMADQHDPDRLKKDAMEMKCFALPVGKEQDECLVAAKSSTTTSRTSSSSSFGLPQGKDLTSPVEANKAIGGAPYEMPYSFRATGQFYLANGPPPGEIGLWNGGRGDTSSGSSSGADQMMMNQAPNNIFLEVNEKIQLPNTPETNLLLNPDALSEKSNASPKNPVNLPYSDQRNSPNGSSPSKHAGMILYNQMWVCANEVFSPLHEALYKGVSVPGMVVECTDDP